jgi:hypothetical protein
LLVDIQHGWTTYEFTGVGSVLEFQKKQTALELYMIAGKMSPL